MDLAQKCADLADGLTLPLLIARNARDHGDLPALTAGEQTLTWADLRHETAVMARGLADLGLAAGERMMIMMASRPEHWAADLAAVHLGAVPCTAYATLSAEQVQFVARHSGATVAVLEGASELDRWLPALAELPALRTVLVVDDVPLPDVPMGMRAERWSTVHARGTELHAQQPDVFEQCWQGVKADDPVAMMYTSGTTGDPKGVVLSHHNVLYQAIVLDELVPLPRHTPAIAYLPLAHIAERELGIYKAAYQAGHITICADPTQVLGALAQTRPPAFFGVPRVWEKMAAGLQAIVAAAEEPRRTAVREAQALRLEAFALRGCGEVVPDALARAAAAADEQHLAPLRALLGLGELRWASSGSAPLSLDVLHALAGFGIEILEVWGLSETTGCATVSTEEAFRPGAVGRAVPGVEVRVAEDGEIFVRGPVVFLGYLQEDGSVLSGTDGDGWFPTGDIGTLDDEGFLTITDRKKELIITSSGKNIAPTRIEALLRAHPLVGQALAVGDRRPYVTAVLTLDEESAPAWAVGQGLAPGTLAELAADPAVRSELDALVASVNARLARVEQVKAFALLPDSWTPETGELTPTMKLRRRVVLDRYASTVEGLYA